MELKGGIVSAIKLGLESEIKNRQENHQFFLDNPAAGAKKASSDITFLALSRRQLDEALQALDWFESKWMDLMRD